MALSSNSSFNDAVEEGVKSPAEEKRIGKLVKGYRYTIGTDRKKRDFLKKFEND
jgi:hypothetical protein